MLRRVLRIALPEKFIHIVGDIHCPLGQFFFRDIILEGHHPVFLRDTAGLAVIILMEGAPGIPDIAQIGKIAALVHCHVPAVCLIVNVIPQMLRHLHGVQFLDVVPAQVVIVLDRRVQVIAVQVVREVDDLLQAAGMVAHLHSRLKLRVLALAHFLQLRRQVIEFVQVFILAQLVIEGAHIAVIVRDEPFLIGLPEIVLLADPDPVKHFFQFLGGGWEFHPLAHKLAFVVLSQVRDEGGKGIIFAIFKLRHTGTSLQFRRRLVPDGLRSVFSRTFLFALFQPFPDGRLFLRLPPSMLHSLLMLPLVPGEGQVSVLRKTPAIFLHGLSAKGDRVNGRPERRGQLQVKVLLQVPPSQVLHLFHLGLQDEEINVVRKFPELFRRGQAVGGRLDRRQQALVLRGKGGDSLRHRRQIVPAHIRLFTAGRENKIRDRLICHCHQPFFLEIPA